MSALSELCSTLLREVTQRETFDLPTWMWCWMRFGFFFFVLCQREGFRRNGKKNISLLKTLNQNISDLVSVDRLVDSLLQRQLSWCVNALRQFVQDVVVLKWEGFLSSDELTAQMSVASWRLRSLRADVGVGSRVLDSEVAGFLSEDAVINSAVVQSPWPSL